MIAITEDSFLSDILAHHTMRLSFKNNCLTHKEYACFMQKYEQIDDKSFVICSVQYSLETHDFLTLQNFELMGSQVFLAKKNQARKRVGSCNESIKIVSCKTPYTPPSSWLLGLQELAHQIGQVSHFAQNEALGSAYKKIYTQWLTNTFAGYASMVWVAQKERNLAGLISLRRRNNEFMIDLLGVREKYRRRGIAGCLLYHAIEYAKIAGGDITVCTQGENNSALRLYEQWGFSQEEHISVYHAYKKRSADEKDRITYRSGRIHRQ